mgnify:CR=1 FL=1
MSLLRDIQNSATASKTDVPALLRKCKILAARLGNAKFKEWIDFELNGYQDKHNLPTYRIIKTKSYGDFCGLFGSGGKNLPIPPACIPEEFREYITTLYLMAPVSSYSELLSSPDGNFREHWPEDLVVYYGQNIYENMNCVNAWKIVPRNSIAAVIDTIITCILSFVLEIEAEAPDAGEAPPNMPPISQEKVTQVFNTYISGNIQNVATGSHHFKQISDTSISQNDFTSLYDFLKAQGIPHDDLFDLEKAIHDDAKENNKKTMGQHVHNWLNTMIEKTKSGSWNIATSVASTLLGKALSKYFGL